MPENLTVVYAAGTLQDAHQLRNLLADAGIHAIVTNESLQGAFGNFLGWQGLTRVAVRDEDATRARDIALEFDRRIAPAAENDSSGEDELPEEDSAAVAEVSAMRRGPDDAVPGLRRHRRRLPRG